MHGKNVGKTFLGMLFRGRPYRSNGTKASFDAALDEYPRHLCVANEKR